MTTSQYVSFSNERDPNEFLKAKETLQNISYSPCPVHKIKIIAKTIEYIVKEHEEKKILTASDFIEILQEMIIDTQIKDLY